MLDDVADRRLASMILDGIGDLGINVAVYRVGREAEGGWELLAWREDSSEQWRVESDRAYEAVCELAELVGFEVEDG